MRQMHRCLDVQNRAKRRIPGMTQLLSKRPDQFSLGVWPGYYAKAQGASLWDLDGNEYLDMSIGGIGATILGYADPEVDGAVGRAIGQGVASSLNCEEEVVLAERLCQLHPFADMVRLTRSGGEAMAMAVRIARTATGRDVVAFCGYHGWHDWYLAANLNQDCLQGHLLDGLAPAGVPAGLRDTALPFRYNHPEELAAIIARNPGKLAAVVMEPIRNTPPLPEFLDQVRALAKAAGAVLIFDEISVGFRMRLGGAHPLYTSQSPDMAVFAKALGNGYPIAAVIGTQAVMSRAQDTFISSTNWTERIGPSAALATLDCLERRDCFGHLAALGREVQAVWRRCADQHGLEISIGGMDPMAHFSFRQDHSACKALFVQEMLSHGILASTLFYAMAAHTGEHVERYGAAASEAFQRIAQARESGALSSSLRGAPAAMGFSRLA